MVPRWREVRNALVIATVLAVLFTAFCDEAHAQESGVNVMAPCAVAFECADGVVLANATVSWKFSFSARRPGIYDIAHWTIRRTGQPMTECVAQLGMRMQGEHPMRYYRIYERIRARNWKYLWFRHEREWREREWGSERHTFTNAELSRLFGIAMALRHGIDPATLTF